MLPNDRALLIATFNFSNKNKTAYIIILRENHSIKKNKKITHTLNKYFTDLTETLKSKKISPALKKNPSGTSAETLQSSTYQRMLKHFNDKEKIAFR